MKGTITKIHEPKASRNGDTTFIRVEFLTEDGNWAKTDLCRSYRNWSNWKDLLAVGNSLDNLGLKSPNSVNADSKPILIKKV